jgi:NAD(P)H dehydrogenase (quinone)
MPSHLIAVTGATGYVGGRVAALLAARGADLRLVVRDPSRAPSLDPAEVRAASGYGDREGMCAALDGAHTLFLVPAEESEDRVEQHRTAVDAAVDAGVQRIVYLSYIGANPDSTFLLGRHHAATEEHVRATGLPWTFPRMSLYLDFVPSMVSPDGVIAGPAGDGRLAAVARDDVAAVAAEVLLAAGGYDGQTLDMTGREAFTLAEAAAELSRLGGPPIRYRDETLEEARASRAGYGAPDWMVEAWISTYTAIAAGDLAAVSDTVERLTGRPPVTLAEYVRSTRTASPT